MGFKVLRERDAEEWESILARFPKQHYSLFHSPAYVLTWKRLEQAEVICLYFSKGGAEFLYPFLKKRITEFPGFEAFSDITSVYGYGGIVSNLTVIDPAIIEALNREIDRWCLDNHIVAEFIREYPVTPCFRNSLRRHVRDNLVFKYPDQRELFPAHIKKRARRDARAAIKKGCTARIDLGARSIDRFYGLYKEFCRAKGFSEFYSFSEDYIRDVRRLLAQQAFIVNIEHDGSLIASSLNFIYNQSVIYHLSASAPSFSQLLPNDLMLYKILEFGEEQNCGQVFLGGGLTTDPEDSLFRFKEKFATDTCEVYIGTKVINETIYADLCRAWEAAFPKKLEKYRNFFLKYRE